MGEQLGFSIKFWKMDFLQSGRFATFFLFDYTTNSRTCWQWCGSGMIYSGSSFEFLEFRSRIQLRIQIQPILLKHIWNFEKNKIK